MWIKNKKNIFLSLIFILGLAAIFNNCSQLRTGVLTGKQQSKKNDATVTTQVLPSLPTTINSANSATGKFYIVGKDIIDPQGNIFLPIGANVGIQLNFDWKGVANGHSTEAVEWGWNTVRLTTYCTDFAEWTTKSRNGFEELTNQIDSFVQEYTSKKIVVILECHDVTGTALKSENLLKQIETFFIYAAQKYKNNTYVWFNPLNEPTTYENKEWVDLQLHFLKVIRSLSSENIFIADLTNMGQDAGWNGALPIYNPQMGPQVSEGQCNVLFSLHAYGGIGGEQEYLRYFENVQKANLPLIVGEFGHTIDGSSTAGEYKDNVKAAHAILNLAFEKKIGFLFWHGTHGDNYSLKKSGGAFFSDGGAAQNLSSIGQRMWDLIHVKRTPEKYEGDLKQSHCRL